MKGRWTAWVGVRPVFAVLPPAQAGGSGRPAQSRGVRLGNTTSSSEALSASPALSESKQLRPCDLWAGIASPVRLFGNYGERRTTTDDYGLEVGPS